MTTIPAPTPADLARDAAADLEHINALCVLDADGTVGSFEAPPEDLAGGFADMALCWLRRAAAAEAEREELLAELARLREVMDDVADNLKKRKREYE